MVRDSSDDDGRTWLRSPSRQTSTSTSSSSCSTPTSDMPPDRTRSVNPQGRQKSCAECAKGKRKCDLVQPSCSRCRKQQINCTYPPQDRAERTHISSQEDTILETDTNLTVDDAFIDLNADSVPMDFNLPTMPGAVNTDMDFDFSAGVTSLQSLNNMIYSSPNSEDQMAIERGYHRKGNNFSVTHIAPFAKTRVGWSIEKLKLTLRTMVEQGGTPWQHPKLYEEYMPRCLQDVHAACALYITKNDTNEDLVTRYITNRVDELIICPIPTQPAEILARAHTYMLYQTILVFGGDIRLYGQAEKLLPHMAEIGETLLDLTTQQDDPQGSLLLYPSAAARTAWRAYIFRESARRTLLCLHHFITLCNLLRGQLTTCRDHLAIGNRVTLSAHLWQADNAFDFGVAWNTSKHFLVKDLDFTEVLRHAKPDDLDTFSKMMLIGLQGIDDMKGWFYTRGGVL